jgi:hypothetical protein
MKVMSQDITLTTQIKMHRNFFILLIFQSRHVWKGHLYTFVSQQHIEL